MIKIKKIIFLIIKSLLALVVFLTVVLFFYAAFFYEPPLVEEKIVENQVTKSEESSVIEEEKRIKQEEEQKLTEAQVTKKIQVETEIEDGLYATVGNKAITKSDIINEIKIILILNNKSYSEEEREQLRQMAIKSLIKRNIKQIEIERRNFLQFNQEDLKNELLRMANNINMDIDMLKNVFTSNELDFSLFEDQIKIELLWNSLIFALYRNRVSINLNEIDEQLKLYQDKKEFGEFLISEIIIKPVQKDKLESEIKKIKDKINKEGFEKVAMSLSISQTAVSGGNLGWVNENVISRKFRSEIINTPVGSISEPIFLPEGVLFFKVRDKRKLKKSLNLEDIKNQLVNAEKTKILNMHSLSHYDKVRRSISIKFY